MKPNEETIFAEALKKQGPQDRAAFLDEACAGDHGLRKSVESLLSAYDAGEFLEAGAPDLRRTVDQPPIAEKAGAAIGPYKLLQQIGEGGMGTVFMAEQTQPVQRKVALKIIKAGMDSKQVIARFEAERQALALMDHPNIAKVLDAGATEASRPYFVMELVKGVPITKYCDEHRLTLRQRLDLFVSVCHAVQHAHQKGIIHRDLKPSNVLIAQYDGRPVPKVIDFGIAKAAGLRLTEKTLFTELGQVVGTFEYMSPEQAELNQLDIDTRSDIYSLGVLLYELLTGSTPLERKHLKNVSFLEVLRLIREEESPRPSTRLSTTDELPSIAANRGLEPKKLNGLVRGELDWIVMKALDKDRDRRYETANGFAADVQRYLNDEPVQACPPSASYRLRKFARRNNVALATSGLVALALVIGTVVSVWQAVEATDARELADKRLVLADERLENEKQARADEERERKKADHAAGEERKAKQVAEDRRRQAEAVADLLKSVFHNLDPYAEQTEALDLKEQLIAQLDEAAAHLERETTDPLTQAGLQSALGVAMVGLGQADKAAILFQRALETHKTILGPDHPDTLISMHNLGEASAAAGKLVEALRLHEQTLALRKAKLGTDHPDTLTSMDRLGRAHQAMGNLDLAVELLKQALDKSKVKRGPDHPDTLACVNNLALAYKAAGKFNLVVPLLEQSLTTMKVKLNPEHPNVLTMINNLATAYVREGKLTEAINLHEQTLPIMKKKLGADHPSTLNCMTSLGHAYRVARKFELALDMLDQALDKAKARFGLDHPLTLAIMVNLGATYRDARKHDMALPMLQQTFAMCKTKLGPDHPITLHCMHSLAFAYNAAGKRTLAVPLFEETIAKMAVKLGPNHPDTLASTNDLASAYAAGDERERAIALLIQTLDKMKAELGPNHAEVLKSMHNLAFAYQFSGKLDLALALHRETLKRRIAKLGADHPHTFASKLGLSLVFSELGQFDKQEPLIREILENNKKRQPQNPGVIADQLVGLGFNLIRQKKYADAEPIFRESLVMHEKKQPDAFRTFQVKSMLGEALLGRKKYKEAEPLLLTGYEGMQQRKPTLAATGALRLAEAAERLVQLYEALGQDEQAKEWRLKLEAHREAEKKAAKAKEK